MANWIDRHLILVLWLGAIGIGAATMVGIAVLSALLTD